MQNGQRALRMISAIIKYATNNKPKIVHRNTTEFCGALGFFIAVFTIKKKITNQRTPSKETGTLNISENTEVLTKEQETVLPRSQKPPACGGKK